MRLLAGIVLLLLAAAGFVAGAALIYLPAAVLVGSAELAGLGYALLKIEERARL